MSFVKRAERYVDGVLSGDIPACRYVQQACERQAADLASPPAGYFFDEEKAERVCRFVELCPHIKGPLASRGELIKLEDWQVFILTTVFGWVDKDGHRRFRRVYIEVPRGNGKSSLSSPVGLYCLALDDEAGAEVYSAATTREQARIVFRDAQAMVRRMPQFRKRFRITVPAQAIVQERSESSFRALSADGHTLDGLNIHLAIVDELHAHKSRTVYDVLETGIGKRPQSLLWMITTAGTNKYGICYEVRDYALKVLAKSVDDIAADSTFAIVYTIDKDDDPYEEDTLRKANPNWGVSVDPNSVRQTASKAVNQTSARANYLTKHLNVWVDANDALFDTEHWRACEDRTLDEADFMDDESVIALDLASKKDIAAKVNLYRRIVDGKEHFYVFPAFFLPRAAIEDEVHPLYRGWEMDGYLTVTDGETIDFGAIEDEIRLEAPGRNIMAVVADPWQANYLVTNLQRDGFPAQEFRQTVANMSEATKTLDALMRERRIHHGGNRALEWMIGNVVGHYDAKENVYPRKELPVNKIDGAIALIMALGWWVKTEKPMPIDHLAMVG